MNRPCRPLRTGGRALLHDENENYEVMGHDEPVGRGSVETPLEVYRSLQERGFALEYERVPITDEQAPKWEDVDRIARAVLRVPLRGHVVINCQMGRGRTTTGTRSRTARLSRTRDGSHRPALRRHGDRNHGPPVDDAPVGASPGPLEIARDTRGGRARRRGQ